MRVLITGASGFAGGHLAHLCASAGDDVLGLSLSGEMAPGAGRGLATDLRDDGVLREAVADFRPEVVYHLAALSSVGRSWEEPAQTLSANTSTATNVLEVVRQQAPTARVLWVSSCEVYGAPERLPIAEGAPIAPANPYAVSKAAGDLLAGVYAAAYDIGIVRVRPFNHAGPGQLPSFILSSLARQAAEGRLAGASSVTIATGNPDSRRDFTDVRDVVRAYRLLAAGDDREIYNVCSGRSVSVREQVELVAELVAPLEIQHVIDPTRLRAHEAMDLRGSHDRLTAATGWEPLIPLRQTMADAIAWWEAELSQARAEPRGS